jgi:CheY-like chemotaxis protein
MLSSSAFLFQMPANGGLTVLLATAEPLLVAELQETFHALGLRVQTVAEDEAVMAATRTLEDSAVILLDVRLAGVANGRLLAALENSGIHKRCTIALIADN